MLSREHRLSTGSAGRQAAVRGFLTFLNTREAGDRVCEKVEDFLRGPIELCPTSYLSNECRGGPVPVYTDGTRDRSDSRI